MNDRMLNHVTEDMNSSPYGIEPYENLTISNSFMFSKVMSDPENCKGFLERAFPDLDIGEVVPVPESTHQVAPGLKGIRLDVYAKDGRHLFDVECQTTDKKNLPKRSRYYNSMLDMDQLDSGKNYHELKPVYIIFICTFKLDYGNGHRYTFRRYCEEDPDLALSDGTEIIFYSTKGTENDISEPMQKFLKYMDGEPGAGDGDDYIRKLDASVRYARTRPEWRKEYMDLQMLIKEERAEAEAEAAQAKTEAAQAKARVTKIIQNMLAANYEDETILNITGITKEQLEEIRKK